jgi:hypothetical protein
MGLQHCAIIVQEILGADRQVIDINGRIIGASFFGSRRYDVHILERNEKKGLYNSHV